MPIWRRPVDSARPAAAPDGADAGTILANRALGPDDSRGRYGNTTRRCADRSCGGAAGRDPARRVQGGGRPGPPGGVAAGGDAVPRPRPARGSARPRQDPHRPHPRRGHRRQLPAPAVHSRPAARRRHRDPDLRPPHLAVRAPPRAGVLQPGPRRRDQPRSGQGPVGAPRGDGGAPGDDRRHHPPAAGAVRGAGHPEPDRAGGDLPPARGAARPLPLQGAGQLPGAGGGAQGARVPPRRELPDARAHELGRGAQGARSGGAGGVPRRAHPLLHRLPGGGEPAPGRGRPRRPGAAARLRRLAAGLDRPRRRRPRPGPGARPLLRLARGRQGAGAGRAAPPPGPDLRGRGRGGDGGRDVDRILLAVEVP
jgi:hypothetical protein